MTRPTPSAATLPPSSTADARTAPRTASAEPVLAATPADAESCVAVITLAFADDPPSRWVWPEPGTFLRAFPRFVRAFAGRAFEVGTAHLHAARAGAALWLPPGEAPDEEALTLLLEETVDPASKPAAFSMFEQMGSYHPREPHWHLPLIGVDPARQGRGVGSALLRHALRAADEQGLPAYLEATSPQNAALYARHGFEPLGTVQAAGSPPIVPMLRKPRKR